MLYLLFGDHGLPHQFGLRYLTFEGFLLLRDHLFDHSGDRPPSSLDEDGDIARSHTTQEHVEGGMY